MRNFGTLQICVVLGNRGKTEIDGDFSNYLKGRNCSILEDWGAFKMHFGARIVIDHSCSSQLVGTVNLNSLRSELFSFSWRKDGMLKLEMTTKK